MTDTQKPQPQPTPERKRYEAPKLIEYGDIAKLTQTGGASTFDVVNKKRQVG